MLRELNLDISPVNSKIIWASEESGKLYVSKDGAETWSFVGELDDLENFDFLIQGSYDNAVLAHPFDSNKVYVAGVNIWEFTLTSPETTDQIFEFKSEGTEEFLAL